MSTTPGSAAEARRTGPLAAPVATLRIGELARRSGHSVHAIRWYEAQGLMPGVQRDTAGRRLYVPQHVGWMAVVDRLRRTGMSIAQLRRYATLVRQGRSALADRRALLAAHRETVVARIAEWQAALVLIDEKIGFYGDWIAQGRRPPPLAPVAPAAPAPRRRRSTGA